MTAGLLQSPLSINAAGVITQQQPGTMIKGRRSFMVITHHLNYGFSFALIADGTTVSYQPLTAEQLAKQGYVVSMAPSVASSTTAAHGQLQGMQVASVRSFQTEQQQKNKVFQ